MKYKFKHQKNKLTGNNFFEGLSIEREMEIATATGKMPEQNLSSVFYTRKQDGVLKECDIRTDRWEIAQQAQNKIAIDWKNKKIETQETEATDVPDNTAEH